MVLWKMSEEKFCKHENIKRTKEGEFCLDCGTRKLSKKEVEELYNNGDKLTGEKEKWN